MRLIDADALLKQMKRRKDYVGRSSDPVCLVEDAPTVDAVPVRHGTWDDTRVAFYRVCSECNAIVHNNLDDVFLFSDGKLNYCPRCGAKMDGERRESE